jgi:hypothetical protein
MGRIGAVGSVAIGPDRKICGARRSRSLNATVPVRFPAPLPVCSRIRMHAEIQSVDDVGGGSAHIVTVQTFEREGAEKPICVAQSVGRFTEHPTGA